MAFGETGFADDEPSPPDPRTHAAEHDAKLINRRYQPAIKSWTLDRTELPLVRRPIRSTGRQFALDDDHPQQG
jgi:hypothetical protein